MAKDIKVSRVELLTAARTLNQENEEYMELIENTKASMDGLEGKWEGDSWEAFSAEQEESLYWMRCIAGSVSLAASALTKAAVKYDQLDTDCSELLKL